MDLHFKQHALDHHLKLSKSSSTRALTPTFKVRKGLYSNVRNLIFRFFRRSVRLGASSGMRRSPAQRRLSIRQHPSREWRGSQYPRHAINSKHSKGHNLTFPIGGLFGTALQAACVAASPDVVKILLKGGADPNTRGKENNQVAHPWALTPGCRRWLTWVCPSSSLRPRPTRAGQYPS